MQIPQLSDFKICYETVAGRDLADMLAIGSFINEVPKPIRLTPQLIYQYDPGYGVPSTAKIHPQLPGFSFPKGKHLIMRIDITSSADTTLQIFYMTTKSREYSESKSIRHSINKAGNVLYIPLTQADLYGNIRLDPGDVSGDYYIHSIEVRAVQKIS